MSEQWGIEDAFDSSPATSFTKFDDTGVEQQFKKLGIETVVNGFVP